MSCQVCGSGDDDLRMGVCFDCATEGDIRLAKKSTLQHWAHGVASIFQGVWWERIWRTGEYAPGREWQDY
jgi:NMD protein affecting ribosome stability and mRNA decay